MYFTVCLTLFSNKNYLGNLNKIEEILISHDSSDILIKETAADGMEILLVA